MARNKTIFRVGLIAMLGGALVGCAALKGLLSSKSTPAPKPPSRLGVVTFADSIRPTASEPPVIIRGARGEVVHFALQINRCPDVTSRSLTALRFTDFRADRIGASGSTVETTVAHEEQPKGWTPNGRPDTYGAKISRPLVAGKDATIPVTSLAAWQVLPVPVEVGRAGFIRHTGLSLGTQSLPRALLPLPADKGVIKLAPLRNPDSPADPKAHPTAEDASAPIVWIDVQIPPTVPAGQYKTTCELVEYGRVACTIPVELAVDDFVIPDERHLLMVGTLDWKALERLYPRQFKGMAPALLSRQNPHQGRAIRILDDLVKLAQSHRAQVYIPRLGPTVKWPSGKPPQIDWSDFDSVVAPWLSGAAFGDGMPLGYWPLPTVEKLDRYELAARMEYFQAAAAHFDMGDWLGRSALAIDRPAGVRVSVGEAVEVSELATQLLTLHPRLRVALPLEEEQVLVATMQNPRRIPERALDRVMYVASGLISRPAIQQLPEGKGVRWLRTGDVWAMPSVGAGADEREARLWAWLAFLRNAQMIEWSSILPGQGDFSTPADPGEMIWFYPGAWFGVDQPLPTLQLKWLRRAEQDYEYLWLARQRGQGNRALALARLITRPIELQPAQAVDPVCTMLSGTSNAKAWEEVVWLLSRTILIAQPGQAIDANEDRQLQFAILGWSQNQQRPLLMGRTTEWGLGIVDKEGNNWLNLRLDLDIYNPAEQQPDLNRLKWASVPEAWKVRDEATDVPKLGAYSINRFALDARINLSKLTPGERAPVKVSFIDGYSGKPFSLEVVAPVGACEPREGAPPKIDGSLNDWSADDALHNGKLVLLMSRPAVQRQELRLASTDSAIYSTWTAGNLYLAFKVDGADVAFSNAETSFINYQFRRAWGEDVCEFLIQPVYQDNSVGPLLHVACKPRGQIEITRRLDPRMNANPWQAFAGSDVRYAANIDGAVWRGEIAIPWEAINPPDAPNKKPVLLRFNFVQHQGATGQSASWAGPVDYGRDEWFTGVLEIRQGR